MEQSLLIRNAEMVFQGRLVDGDLRAFGGLIDSVAPGGGAYSQGGRGSCGGRRIAAAAGGN